MPRSEAYVDLNAIRDNVATLRAGTPAEVMAVVKADGYGHGLLPSARAALAGGASWLGVAFLEEAVALRDAGIDAPLLSWLAAPGERLVDAVLRDVDLSVNATWGLAEVVGIWSHFTYADAPDHPTNARQLAAFREALDVAAGLGVTPRIRHLANSAATLTHPDAHFDLVRPGIAVYGLSPVPRQSGYGLVPAMTLRSHVALTKRVPAGTGVSYGHAYSTPRETGLALVPLGYADGVPRNASNVGPLLLAGRRRTISGRVCMDQFVVDVGDDAVAAGDEVLLFGPGTAGEPTAQDWADALDTISYEIVTRVGLRVPRIYREVGA